MKLIKALLVSFLCTAVLSSVTADADGLPRQSGERLAKGTPVIAASAGEATPAIETGECRAAAVYECSTGTLLAEKNGSEALPIGHLAKLMTFCLAADSIKSGSLSLDDTAVCSDHANSQQGSQIWLAAGEKISVDELMRSVSIGNANDAAVCLGEKLFTDEALYCEAASCKASELDMKNTVFADITGVSEKTVSSAGDICKLCSELVKHKDFSAYFTTWMDNVRNGSAELVSRNRLMRSYKGFKGFKVGYTKEAGECAAVCAERGDMTVCAVILGAPDEDALFIQAKKLLDSAFSAYEIYTPEVPEEALAELTVIHGVEPSCEVMIPGLRPIVIPKGSCKSVECTFEREQSLEAPFEEGAPVGHITFLSGDRELLSADICAGEDVAAVDFGFSLKRVLFNLLNI